MGTVYPSKNSVQNFFVLLVDLSKIIQMICILSLIYFVDIKQQGRGWIPGMFCESGSFH